MLPLELLCISPELTTVTLPVLLLLLKNFKNQKRFQDTDCKTNLFKNGRLVNFHMIDLFTSALSDCQNAYSIPCEVFNSIDEVTLSIVSELKSQVL